MKELKLPDHLKPHTKPPSTEMAWRQDQVIPLVEEIVKQGHAPSGWQVQYRFPDGTCDLYWVCFQSDAQKANQAWSEYAAECQLSFINSFEEWTQRKDIKKEVMDFSNVKAYSEEQKQHVDDYRYFLVYSRSINDPVYTPPKNNDASLNANIEKFTPYAIALIVILSVALSLLN